MRKGHDSVRLREPDLVTSGAGKDIADAKISIKSATDKLNDAKASLEGAISSDNPQDSFKPIITAIREIKSDLMEVHRLLVHAIGELKGLRTGNSNEE